jgi:hypothetical protein
VEKRCAICETKLVGKFKNNWFCYKCYKEYEEAIVAKKPWVVFLRDSEQARRRLKELSVVFLGNELDIDTNGKVVYKHKRNNG